MKQFIKPNIKIIEYTSNIICTSSPSEHEHGWNGNGNGKGWGPGGKPKNGIFDTEVY